ncbi:MAG: hypothetical protein ACRC2K_10295 [Clostridium sp.]
MKFKDYLFLGFLLLLLLVSLYTDSVFLQALTLLSLAIITLYFTSKEYKIYNKNKANTSNQIVCFKNDSLGFSSLFIFTLFLVSLRNLEELFNPVAFGSYDRGMLIYSTVCSLALLISLILDVLQKYICIPYVFKNGFLFTDGTIKYFSHIDKIESKLTTSETSRKLNIFSNGAVYEKKISLKDYDNFKTYINENSCIQIIEKDAFS